MEASAGTNVLVIACCSATKSASPRLLARDLAGSTQSDFAASWAKALAGSTSEVPAEDLYRGRGFTHLKQAAQQHGASFAIISAGLGLVDGDTAVPNYSLSLEHGPDALAVKLNDFAPAEWWASITQGPWSTTLAEKIAKHDVTLIALTQPYAKLIVGELEAIADHCHKLRLFGLGLTRVLPAALHRAVLPYAETSGDLHRGGTRGEFGARALAFHLQLWRGRAWDLETERIEVASLAQGSRLQTTRQALADGQILAWLHGRERDRSAGAELRKLRQAGFACGSDRFDRLWQGVQTHG